VREADSLPPSSADVTESGSFNLPEPSGPHTPVMGMLYLYCQPRIVKAELNEALLCNASTRETV
jgi:hypothetical protein